MKMRRIEAFCRNLRHNVSIEEQMSDAQRSGIINSYLLTTLNDMNTRRDANLCLWCDKIWSVDHECEYAPKSNCMFTFGEDNEGFAFVTVSTEGLKHVSVNQLDDKLPNSCSHNLFDERCEPNSCVVPAVELVSKAPKLFEEMLEPNSCLNQVQIVETNVMGAQAARDTNFNPPSNLHADVGLMKSIGHDECHMGLHEHDFLELEIQIKHVSNEPVPNAHKMLDKMSHYVVISTVDRMSTYEVERFYNYENENEPKSIDVVHKKIYTATSIPQKLSIEILLSNARTVLDGMCGLKKCNSISCADLCSEKSSLHTHTQVISTHLVPHINVKDTVLCWGKSNVDYEGLVWKMMSDSICFYWIVVFDPGVLLNRGGISAYTKLFEMIDELNAHVNYQELHSWGKLICSSTISNITDVGVNDDVSTVAKMTFVTPFDSTSITMIFDLALNSLVSIVSFVKVDCYETFTKHWHKNMLKMHTAFPFCQFEVRGMYFCVGRIEQMHLSILTLEDKGDFRGEEEKVSVKYNWKLFNVMVCWRNCFPSRTNKSSVLLLHVFDPGGLHWRCDRIWTERIVRDDMIMPMSWSSLIVDSLTLVHGDPCFETVRTILNWLLGIDKMNGFGENSVNMYDECINFDCRSKDEVLGKLIFTHIYQFGQQKSVGRFLLAPGKALYLLRRLVGVANFETFTLIPTVMLALGHTGLWCASLSNLLTTLWDKFSGLQLNFDIGWCSTRIQIVSFSLRDDLAFMSHIAPLKATEKLIIVFDPGGYKSGLEMRIRLECGVKGVMGERYKDCQVYVFDPGGPSIMQVTNAMLCPSSYGVYYLF